MSVMRVLIPTFVALAFAPLVHAGIVFDLRDIAGLVPDRSQLFDNETSASLTVNGVTGTFSTGGLDELNSNGDRFGINDGNDVTANNNDEIGGLELLTISFDRPVLFTDLDLIALTGAETAELTIGVNPQLSLSSSPGDLFSFSLDNFAALGQTIQLSATNGDFGLETFTVTPVPEPSTLALLGSLCGLAGWRTRRREGKRSLAR